MFVLELLSFCRIVGSNKPQMKITKFRNQEHMEISQTKGGNDVATHIYIFSLGCITWGYHSFLASLKSCASIATDYMYLSSLTLSKVSLRV